MWWYAVTSLDPIWHRILQTKHAALRGLWPSIVGLRQRREDPDSWGVWGCTHSQAHELCSLCAFVQATTWDHNFVPVSGPWGRWDGRVSACPPGLETAHRSVLLILGQPLYTKTIDLPMNVSCTQHFEQFRVGARQTRIEEIRLS